MLNSNVKNNINELWNKFWSGGISNPLNAIEQITYLLFIKQLDEIDKKRESNSKLNKEVFNSLFAGDFYLPGTEKDSNSKIDKSLFRWSYFHDKEQDYVFDLIQNKIFPFIKSLGEETSSFAKHMQNAVFLIPKASLLAEAIKMIDLIYKDISKENRFIDAQGDVYEYLLNQLSQAGKNGQFRTPTHIIELLVELVNPKIGDKIADPACGSAGFLLGAYKYLLSKSTSAEFLKRDDNGFLRGLLGDKLSSNEIKQVQLESLYGFDIDPTMIRLGLMNLMMHGIDNPKIMYNDTLSNNYDEEDLYDIVLANPPFTGSLDKQEINKNFTIKSTKTEILFLERIYKMLKVGGSAAVIVPQGVLFGKTKAFIQIRKILVENCQLKAVIGLPSGVFKPYAGVATAILIFTKGMNTDDVWFYEMEGDGRSLDDKRIELYDEKGIRNFGDLHQIITQYKKKVKGNDRTLKHFEVPKQEIIDNSYNLIYNRYRKVIYDKIEYEEPEQLLHKLIGKDGKGGLEKEILNGLRELKSFLE